MLAATKETNSTTIVSEQVLAAIPNVIQSQRDFFKSGLTKDIDFRIEQLKKFRKAIIKYEKNIYEALKKDLHKCKFETYVTELAAVLKEIDDSIKKVRKWAKPKKVSTALFQFKASSAIHSDPYGIVFLIAPWNYPFQLSVLPLVGAIAAGNCAVLKPSELAPATSAIVHKIISETFDSHYVASFEGAVEVSQALLKQKFDLIFFTGSTRVGKIVYKAAAEHLTPVVLELGGKSPCIVDKDTNLAVTSKRILWGKFTNAGQTCIAPDYLFVHKEIKAPLIEQMKKDVEVFFGKQAEKSNDYGRIISDGHFERLKGLMQTGNILYGGNARPEDRYISPTFIDGVSATDPIMNEEIFGPLLPILTWENIEEPIEFINNRPKPLALYVFSKNNQLAKKILRETSSGGGCINDTLMHFGNAKLPFGGVGDSGIGAYHGKHSFDVFSHKKGILDKSLAIDPSIRYAPFKNIRLIKFLISKFG